MLGLMDEEGEVGGVSPGRVGRGEWASTVGEGTEEVGCFGAGEGGWVGGF